MKTPPQDRFNERAESEAPLHGVLAETAGLMQMAVESARFCRLSGGFMNANFLAEAGADRFVFRVYSTQRETAEREKAVLQLLRSHAGIRVPEVFAICNIQDRTVAVMEYIDGIPLQERLCAGAVPGPDIFREIGEQLARIHSIQFPTAGFIGPGLHIGSEYDDFNLFLKSFIEKTLDWLEQRPDRLDRDTTRRFRTLMRDKWQMTSGSGLSTQLVHGDFNPKNILVSRTPGHALLSIIDWEFCLSGNGLADIGNFFRFSGDYEEPATASFIAGYRNLNPAALPSNWRDICMLLDLANMCGFLERPENYEKTFRTARAVIQSTLEYFDC